MVQSVVQATTPALIFCCLQLSPGRPHPCGHAGVPSPVHPAGLLVHRLPDPHHRVRGRNLSVCFRHQAVSVRDAMPLLPPLLSPLLAAPLLLAQSPPSLAQVASAAPLLPLSPLLPPCLCATLKRMPAKRCARLPPQAHAARRQPLHSHGPRHRRLICPLESQGGCCPVWSAARKAVSTRQKLKEAEHACAPPLSATTYCLSCLAYPVVPPAGA